MHGALTGGATNELTRNKAAKFNLIMFGPDFFNMHALYVHPTFKTSRYDTYGTYGNLVLQILRIYPYLWVIMVYKWCMQYWSIYGDQIAHTHAAACIHEAEQRQPMLLSTSACRPSMQAAHWLLPL